MNYYIQGDAAKADKIKAAFERLGYDTSFVQKLSASDNHILFTLPCDYRVHAFHMAYIEADILKRLVNIDPDYKELKLTIKPKFKAGDEVYNRFDKSSGHVVIESIDETTYYCDATNFDIVDQDDYELVPKFHYDIANFHAGMPVLVRIDNSYKWSYTLFSHYNEGWNCPFSVASCCSIKQCIPFNDDTKHLLGTTDMPSEEYINW